MPVCVVDVETTGLPNQEWARVVEIGAVVLDPHKDYAEVAAFESCVNWSEEALRGYPRNERQRVPLQDIRVAPGADEVYGDFAQWCAKHRVTEVFSYNRAFDETMLARSGFVLPWTGCIMRMARAAMPPRKKDPPLAEAAAHFGIVTGVEEHHRALPDARLAAQVFAAIRRKGR